MVGQLLEGVMTRSWIILVLDCDHPLQSGEKDRSCSHNHAQKAIDRDCGIKYLPSAWPPVSLKTMCCVGNAPIRVSVGRRSLGSILIKWSSEAACPIEPACSTDAFIELTKVNKLRGAFRMDPRFHLSEDLVVRHRGVLLHTSNTRALRAHAASLQFRGSYPDGVIGPSSERWVTNL